MSCLIALGACFCCSFYRCCWLWWKIWLCPLCECLAVKIIITHTTPDTHTHIRADIPTAVSLALISGALYFRQRFSWLCSWLYWLVLVLPRLSCLSPQAKKNFVVASPHRSLTLYLARSLSESLSLFQPVLSYVCFIIARKIRESRYNTNSNTNRNNESNKCSQTVDL